MRYLAKLRYGGGLTAALALGCRPTAAPPEASASATLEQPTRAVPSATAPRPAAMSGPVLTIEAGKGVGPIRLGATVATIERLMDAKCDELSDARCRFIDRAVDFELEGGVTVAIVVYRPGRAAGEGRVYGYFNGGFPPDLRPGMTPEAMQEGLGRPSRVERLTADPDGAVERHYYPGLVLDYDAPSPPLLALGAARVVRRQP